MQNIIPNLWFDGIAEEAVNFYVNVFNSVGKSAHIGDIKRYGPSGANVSGRKEGDVLTIKFELDGTEFIAINAGPEFKFTPAVSFMVTCDNQNEIDKLWDELSAVPEAEQCGWLQDTYGISWQIVPKILDKLIDTTNPNSEKVMEKLLSMKKIVIADLESVGKVDELF